MSTTNNNFFIQTSITYLHYNTPGEKNTLLVLFSPVFYIYSCSLRFSGRQAGIRVSTGSFPGVPGTGEGRLPCAVDPETGETTLAAGETGRLKARLVLP
jgi:hypothetical protein